MIACILQSSVVELGSREDRAAAERDAEGVENDGRIDRKRGEAITGVPGGNIEGDWEY
jgi:hypothetical protein